MALLKKHTSFGEHLRTLRENAGVTLKNVSEKVGIDISLLAKFERNERQPTKLNIKQIADYFMVDEKDLHNDYLSDQIAYKIINEEADLSILKLAEQKIKYLKNNRYNK